MHNSNNEVLFAPSIVIPVNDIIKDAYLHYCSFEYLAKYCPVELYYYNSLHVDTYLYSYTHFFISKQQDPVTCIGSVDYFGLNYLVPFFAISTMEKRDMKKAISKHFDWVEDSRGLSLFTKKHGQMKQLALSSASSEISLDKALKVVDNTELSL